MLARDGCGDNDGQSNPSSDSPPAGNGWARLRIAGIAGIRTLSVQRAQVVLSAVVHVRSGERMPMGAAGTDTAIEAADVAEMNGLRLLRAR